MTRFHEQYAEEWAKERAEDFTPPCGCQDCAESIARLTVERNELRAQVDMLRQVR